MKMSVQLCLWDLVFSVLLGKYPQMGLLNHLLIYFNCFRKCQTLFNDSCTLLPYVTTWMNFENIILSEINQSQRWMSHDFIYVHAKLFQSCPDLLDTLNYSPPSSTVHRILQARILEWVAMPSSRGYSQWRDWTFISNISCIGRWVLYH